MASQMAVLPALATGVYEMPVLSAGDRTWVFDKGDVLSRSSESNISSVLDNLENKTGKQVRLVTIHRLDYGETTATFTDQLFEQWFPAKEDRTNQILLVLDTVTNSAAIRTGEGVKSLLTDEIAQSVAGETVQVPLREGNNTTRHLPLQVRALQLFCRANPIRVLLKLLTTFKLKGRLKKLKKQTKAMPQLLWLCCWYWRQ